MLVPSLTCRVQLRAGRGIRILILLYYMSTNNNSSSPSSSVRVEYRGVIEVLPLPSSPPLLFSHLHQLACRKYRAPIRGTVLRDREGNRWPGTELVERWIPTLPGDGVILLLDNEDKRVRPPRAGVLPVAKDNYLYSDKNNQILHTPNRPQRKASRSPAGPSSSSPKRKSPKSSAVRSLAPTHQQRAAETTPAATTSSSSAPAGMTITVDKPSGPVQIPSPNRSIPPSRSPPSPAQTSSSSPPHSNSQTGAGHTSHAKANSPARTHGTDNSQANHQPAHRSHSQDRSPSSTLHDPRHAFSSSSSSSPSQPLSSTLSLSVESTLWRIFTYYAILGPHGLPTAITKQFFYKLLLDCKVATKDLSITTTHYAFSAATPKRARTASSPARSAAVAELFSSTPTPTPLKSSSDSMLNAASESDEKSAAAITGGIPLTRAQVDVAYVAATAESGMVTAQVDGNINLRQRYSPSRHTHHGKGYARLRFEEFLSALAIVGLTFYIENNPETRRRRTSPGRFEGDLYAESLQRLLGHHILPNAMRWEPLSVLVPPSAQNNFEHGLPLDAESFTVIRRFDAQLTELFKLYATPLPLSPALASSSPFSSAPCDELGLPWYDWHLLCEDLHLFSVTRSQQEVARAFLQAGFQRCYGGCFTGSYSVRSSKNGVHVVSNSPPSASTTPPGAGFFFNQIWRLSLREEEFKIALLLAWIGVDEFSSSSSIPSHRVKSLFSHLSTRLAAPAGADKSRGDAPNPHVKLDDVYTRRAKRERILTEMREKFITMWREDGGINYFDEIEKENNNNTATVTSPPASSSSSLPPSVWQYTLSSDPILPTAISTALSLLDPTTRTQALLQLDRKSLTSIHKDNKQLVEPMKSTSVGGRPSTSSSSSSRSVHTAPMDPAAVVARAVPTEEEKRAFAPGRRRKEEKKNDEKEKSRRPSSSPPSHSGPIPSSSAPSRPRLPVDSLLLFPASRSLVVSLSVPPPPPLTEAEKRKNVSLVTQERREKKARKLARQMEKLRSTALPSPAPQFGGVSSVSVSIHGVYGGVKSAPKLPKKSEKTIMAQEKIEKILNIMQGKGEQKEKEKEEEKVDESKGGEKTQEEKTAPSTGGSSGLFSPSSVSLVSTIVESLSPSHSSARSSSSSRSRTTKGSHYDIRGANASVSPTIRRVERGHLHNHQTPSLLSPPRPQASLGGKSQVNSQTQGVYSTPVPAFAKQQQEQSPSSISGGDVSTVSSTSTLSSAPSPSNRLRHKGVGAGASRRRERRMRGIGGAAGLGGSEEGDDDEEEKGGELGLEDDDEGVDHDGHHHASLSPTASARRGRLRDARSIGETELPASSRSSHHAGSEHEGGGGGAQSSDSSALWDDDSGGESSRRLMEERRMREKRQREEAEKFYKEKDEKSEAFKAESKQIASTLFRTADGADRTGGGGDGTPVSRSGRESARGGVTSPNSARGGAESAYISSSSPPVSSRSIAGGGDGGVVSPAHPSGAVPSSSSSTAASTPRSVSLSSRPVVYPDLESAETAGAVLAQKVARTRPAVSPVRPLQNLLEKESHTSPNQLFDSEAQKKIQGEAALARAQGRVLKNLQREEGGQPDVLVMPPAMGGGMAAPQQATTKHPREMSDEFDLPEIMDVEGKEVIPTTIAQQTQNPPPPSSQSQPSPTPQQTSSAQPLTRNLPPLPQKQGLSPVSPPTPASSSPPTSGRVAANLLPLAASAPTSSAAPSPAPPPATISAVPRAAPSSSSSAPASPPGPAGSTAAVAPAPVTQKPASPRAAIAAAVASAAAAASSSASAAASPSPAASSSPAAATAASSSSSPPAASSPPVSSPPSSSSTSLSSRVSAAAARQREEAERLQKEIAADQATQQQAMLIREAEKAELKRVEEIVVVGSFFTKYNSGIFGTKGTKKFVRVSSHGNKSGHTRGGERR